MHQLPPDPTVGDWQRPTDSGPSILLTLWRRKMLIVLATAVAAALGAIHVGRQVPVYQSATQILVVKKSPSHGGGVADPQAFVDDYVSAHLSLLKSRAILEQAVVDGNLGSLESFRGTQNAAVRITGGLSIYNVGSQEAGTTNILQLTYRGMHSEDCQHVLEAVVGSYQKFLTQTYENVSDETVQMITVKADAVQKQLREKEDAYRKFREEMPRRWTPNSDEPVAAGRIGAINGEISSLRIRRTKLESRLATIQTAIAENQSQAELLAMIRKFDESHPLRFSNEGAGGSVALAGTNVEEQVLPLKIEEQLLLARYGRNHPKVQSLRMQAELMREFYSPGTAGDSADEAATEKPYDPVFAYVALLKQEQRDLTTYEQKLNELLLEEEQSIQQLAKFEFTDNQFRNDIARTQRFYDTLLTQLQSINLGKDFGGFVTSVIEPPGPGVQVEPQPSKTLSYALMLGLFAGVGLAYVAELANRKFRNPNEIRERLGLQVLAQIPRFGPSAVDSAVTRLDPMLIVQHKPKSVESESYRGLRTSLYFSAKGEGHRVIQVTSPNQGDGKSTLISNLAISIAQSGKRVLLVDADLRRPRVHSVFGLSKTLGLTSVILDEVELHDAIQATDVENLSLIACGPVPPNPAELLTSNRFEEFLAVVREQFEYVLVDTPPLGAVSDPSVVASMVDGVVLALEVTKDSRASAERATETLESVGANILGVAVNGFRANGPSYGSGYGNGYGNGYGGYYGGYTGYGETAPRSIRQSKPKKSNGSRKANESTDTSAETRFVET